MKQLSLITVSLISTLLFLQEAKAQSNITKYGGFNLINNTGSNNSAFGTFALSVNSTGHNNTATGALALYRNSAGHNNTATGHEALRENTTGNYNTATGQGALWNNTTANSNTATGVQALHKNTTGYWNTADGVNALYSNITGYYNTAGGVHALYFNTSGYSNTANGINSLYKNTTGFWNTASGVNALYSNTTGTHNTATGFQALYLNSTGTHNTAAGSYALQNNTTGARNTAIGDSAGARFSYNYSTFVGYKTTTSVSGLTNVTVIGNQASATASNQVRIGNTYVTSIGGKVGWTTLSDGRYKKNIQADVPGLEFITKLKPVTYTLDIAAIDKASGMTEQGSPEEASSKAEAAKEKHTGFVAQDVEKVAQDLKYDFGGVDKPKNDKDLYGLRYAEFVVPLVKGMQEQQTQIGQLQQENDELKARIDRLEKLISGAANTLTSTSGSLEQNMPNPASGTTTIRYQVPQTSNTARLNITDAKGQLVQTIPLNNKGTGQVNFSTSMLASGTYNYTLYVDGKQADTKRLVIAR